MLHEKRKDDRSVDDDGAIVFSRRHAPDQENHFDEKVHWEPRKQDVDEDFGDGKGAVDDPVGQPLFGRFGVAGFKRLDGFDCWIAERHQRNDKWSHKVHCRADYCQTD